MRKITQPLGFDPRTVKPVASRYTDCAIPAQPNKAQRKILILRSSGMSVNVYAVFSAPSSGEIWFKIIGGEGKGGGKVFTSVHHGGI
jgi:hypothetical protein